MKSKAVLAIVLLILITPKHALSQDAEHLFCSSCGKESQLKAVFCFDCGHKLDKTALASRLKVRLAKADSLQQSVLFTLDEISVLVEEGVESRARELTRSMRLRTSRQKTQVERTLDVVVPIVAGTAAVYFLSQTFYRTQ